MKLPQINYNKPVERLELEGQGANVASSLAKIGVAVAAGNLANEIVDKAVKHQANTARSATLRRMADWSKKNDGVAFYDSAKLAGEGVPEHVLRGRETIPSHEVKPQLYEQEYRRVMEEEGAKIYASKYQDQYFRSAGDDLYIKRAAYTVTASKEQRTQQNAQIKTDIDELLIDREYDLALERVNELRVPDSERKDLVGKINSDREFASYVDIVNFKQVNEAKEALKILTSEDSKNMDEILQYRAINLLESFLAEDNTAKSLEKAHIKWLLNRIEKNATQGGAVDYNEFIETMEYAQAIGVEPRFMTETNTAVTANAKSKLIANKPAAEQMALMQAEELASKTTEGGIASAFHRSITTGNIAHMKKDPIGYYNSVNGGIKPIDFVGLAHIEQATGKAMALRKQQHDVIYERLGETRGYLSEDFNEPEVLADLLLNAKPDEIMAFALEMEMALGRDAVNLYDQLRVTRKELGSLTVVGQLSAIGQKSAAAQVLRGHEFRKENPEAIQDLMQAFLPEIHEQINQVYRGNPRYLNTIKNAVLDVYVDKANQQGLLIGDDLDDDTLEAAVATVTGGILEHNDNLIEPPYYGAPQAIMDDWLENLSPLYIDEMGGAYHYSSKQVTAKINDDEFTLESFGGMGKYVVRTGKGKYLATKAGGRFILEFDHLAPVVPQSESIIFKDNADKGFGVRPIPSLTEALER
jgi:hypothetical protein